MKKENIRFENMFRHFNSIMIELNKLDIVYYIAGGCIRDYFKNKQASDIDLFFTKKEHFLKSLEYFMKNGAEIILNNDNVIKLKYDNTQFDLIKKLFENEKDLINNFDFTIAQFVISYNYNFVYTNEAFQDLSKNQLMLANLKYPESTMLRVRKYMMKGYNICHEEFNKIIFGIKYKSYDAVKQVMIKPNYDFHPYTINSYKSTIFNSPKRKIKQKEKLVNISTDELIDMGYDVIEMMSNNTYRFAGID